MHAHVVSVVHGCCRHLCCPPASPKLQKGGGAQRYHFLTEPKLYNKLWCTFTGLKLCATHVWTVVPQSLSSASRTAAIRPSRFFEGLFRDRDCTYITCVRLYHTYTHARPRTRTRRIFQLVYRLTFARTQLHGSYTTHVALCAVTFIEHSNRHQIYCGNFKVGVGLAIPVVNKNRHQKPGAVSLNVRNRVYSGALNRSSPRLRELWKRFKN